MSEMQAKKTGVNIRTIRNNMGLTKTELSRRAGLGHKGVAWLSRVENGQRSKRIDQFRVLQIAKALGVEYEDLVEGAAQITESPESFQSAAEDAIVAIKRARRLAKTREDSQRLSTMLATALRMLTLCVVLSSPVDFARAEQDTSLHNISTKTRKRRNRAKLGMFW